jgi:hypothetical protein
MITLNFWRFPDIEKDPVLETSVSFDEDTGVATWTVMGTAVQDILYSGNHMIFNDGPFDPKRADHWKAIPYLFHGIRSWATIEGAEAAIPADAEMYLSIMEAQRKGR